MEFFGMHTTAAGMFMANLGIAVTIVVVLLGTFALVSKNGPLHAGETAKASPEVIKFQKERQKQNQDLARKAKDLDSRKQRSIYSLIE